MVSNKNKSLPGFNTIAFAVPLYRRTMNVADKPVAVYCSNCNTISDRSFSPGDCRSCKSTKTPNCSVCQRTGPLFVHLMSGFSFCEYCAIVQRMQDKHILEVEVTTSHLYWDYGYYDDDHDLMEHFLEDPNDFEINVPNYAFTTMHQSLEIDADTIIELATRSAPESFKLSDEAQDSLEAFVSFWTSKYDPKWIVPDFSRVYRLRWKQFINQYMGEYIPKPLSVIEYPSYTHIVFEEEIETDD